jgi:tetratricopeptide (TPR) repeat protein
MQNDRIRRLLTMLENDPLDLFLQYALAMEFKNENDTESAIKYLEAVKQQDPDYIGLYYQLGKLYESTEQPARAIEIYEAGISRAASLKDLHTLAELKNAKVNLEMEL